MIVKSVGTPDKARREQDRAIFKDINQFVQQLENGRYKSKELDPMKCKAIFLDFYYSKRWPIEIFFRQS